MDHQITWACIQARFFPMKSRYDPFMQMVLTLLAEMADGRPHSYSALQQSLSVSRDGLERLLRSLTDSGTSLIREDDGVGLRLPQPLDWLDEEQIRAHLPADINSSLNIIDILPATASTNEWLFEQPLPEGPRCCMTEFQYAGKGRRGRVWLNPPATNIALSIAWPWGDELGRLQGLTLAIGAAAADSIRRLGGKFVGVKWPNDLVCDGRKLGGILVEARGVPGGMVVVVGIGLNVFITHHDDDRFGQPAIDLVAICGRRPERNEITALLLSSMLSCFRRFRDLGFKAWKREFEGFDVSNGQVIDVVLGDEKISGIAKGVNDVGQLIVHTANSVKTLSAGEVSLRKNG